MSGKKAVTYVAVGLFGVALLRNGTIGKLTNTGAAAAKQVVGGTAKISRKI